MFLIDDWAGWIVFLSTFVIPLISRTIKKNNKVFISVYLVILAHQFTSLINTYYFTLPGAGKDAIGFHRTASFLSKFSDIDLINTGAEFYSNYLALFYKMFGDSLFLGSQLSVLTFVISLLIVLKISQTLDVNFIIQKYVTMFFGLMPSMILNTSITLRESFQVFLLLLICFYAIKAKKEKNIRYLAGLCLAIPLFAVWHNGFMALSPILAFITFYWVFKKLKVSIVNFIGLMTGFLIMVTSFLLISTGVISSPAATSLISGELSEYASSYREGSNLSSRASYGVQLDTSSLLGFTTSFPVVVFGYFLAPLPWKASSTIDIVAMFENFIRIILIFGAFKSMNKLEGEKKSIAKYLMTVYFIIEIMWSAGTVNWGTAMRHHVVAYSLLVIVGGKESFKIFIKKPYRHKVDQ